METCAYEQLRRKNLEDNKRILAELGLSNPYRLLPKVIKKGIKRPADDDTYQPKKKKAKHATVIDLENSGSIRGTRRLSARLRGQDPGTECIGEDDTVEEEEHEKSRVRYVMPDRPNWYGEVQGVDVGTIWLMRIDCCHDGIHRPTVAGIHAGPDGAYSIALSGGYEDDVDLGDCFTYTGEGGRDLKGTRNNPKNLRTAPQSKDQELTRGNLALSRSVETGNPVRVIRGYKLRSPFAPDEGYRYDGLYTVEKYWFTKGLSGHGVYKFALRRCKDQAPPPWELASNDAMSPSKNSDSGYSDSVNPETDSNDGEKSEAGDDKSNHASDCLDSKTDSSDRNITKNDEDEGLANSVTKDEDSTQCDVNESEANSVTKDEEMTKSGDDSKDESSSVPPVANNVEEDGEEVKRSSDKEEDRNSNIPVVNDEKVDCTDNSK